MRNKRKLAIAVWILVQGSVLVVCGPLEPTAPTIIPTLTSAPTSTPPFEPEKPIPSASPEVVEPIRRVPLPEDFPQDAFSLLKASPDGTLWLWIEGGILKLQGDTWSPYVSDIDGYLVGLDENDLAWIVSPDNAQISAWDGAAWRVYSEEDGWLSLGVNSRVQFGVVNDHLGQIWIATDEDVRVLAGGSWTVFGLADMGLEQMDEDLWLDFTIADPARAAEVWVGTCIWAGPGPMGGQGVVRYDGVSWRRAGDEVASGCTAAIEEDGAGRVWIGLDEDLWRFDPQADQWDRFEPPAPTAGPGSFYNAVGAIMLDPIDEPWAEVLLCGGASCGGEVLFHIHEGAWIQVADQDSHYTRKLLFDAMGTPWLFVEAFDEGGIFRVEDDRLEKVSDLDIDAQSAILDAEGRFWFVVQLEEGNELWILEP